LFLSGYFAQLLRYTAPADAQSRIVRLRSAETTSLAFEQNSTLKIKKKRRKIEKKVTKSFGKIRKKKKKTKN